MDASWRGHSSCIELLLSHGANVNDKSDKVSVISYNNITNNYHTTIPTISYQHVCYCYYAIIIVWIYIITVGC